MWHNGEYVGTASRNILIDKWKIAEVINGVNGERPELAVFNNCVLAIKLLNKHINAMSRVAIHFDVDVDGLGSGFIMNKILETNGIKNKYLVVNKGKTHGIQEKHAKYFNDNKMIDLLIIVDSSTNSIDIIKQFNCDVLVIDHHDSAVDIDCGLCNDGIHEFVVVNNTIENKNFEQDNKWLKEINSEALKNVTEYQPTCDMSCGLEVFELMRLYYNCYSSDDILFRSLMYEWSAITLFTDSIDTLNSRNQWYIQNTIHNSNIEATLSTIGQTISEWRVTLDKSYIQYKFAPIINKAIRADAGSHMIDIVANRPNNFMELLQYGDKQEDAINAVYSSNEVYEHEYVMKNLTGKGISPNYHGVIAARISGENNKNVICYSLIDGKYKGSFRGRVKGFDYKAIFLASGIQSDGHGPAFGFEEESEDKLREVMQSLDKYEPDIGHVKHYITLGNLADGDRGVYHIDSLEEFRKSGLLMGIAYGNSNVISSDEIHIGVAAKDIVMEEMKEKFIKYKLLGELDCIAFEPLVGNVFNLYVEFTNEIKMYLRNIK